MDTNLEPTHEKAPVPLPHNFLVIFIDDLGLDQLAVYDDVNAYRTIRNDYPYARTPNLDRLATRGVRFNQARAYPICSPSRAALQSGQYGLRTGCGSLVRGVTQGEDCQLPPPDACVVPNFEFSVPPQPVVTTLPRMLKPKGYSTGMFGKVHLHLEEGDCGPGCGTGDDYPRSVLGYDTFRGVARNPNTPPVPPNDICMKAIREVAFTYYYWIEDGVRTVVSGPESSPCGGTYLTEKQRRRTQHWIRFGADEPFLAQWNTSDIHGPYQWPPALLDGEATHGFGATPPDEGMGVRFQNTRVRAKIEYLDGAIGRLLQNINSDVLARTTIMIMGDNGTQASLHGVQAGEARYPKEHPSHSPGDEAAGFSMAPYDVGHFKRTSYEQGVRVPLIVSGHAVRQGGRTSEALVDVTDVFETLRELVTPRASYVPAGGDSISFADILRGEPDEDHARQFSHAARRVPNGFGMPVVTENAYYLRRGTDGNLWKIVQQRMNRNQLPDEFYNVSVDPLETKDLGTGHPEYAQTRADFDAL